MTPVGLYPNSVGRPYLHPELGWGEVAETHVGALIVVVPPPAFDPELGLRPVPKLLEGQAFVPELPVDSSVSFCQGLPGSMNAVGGGHLRLHKASGEVVCFYSEYRQDYEIPTTPKYFAMASKTLI